jgi:hypothetical protein
MLGCTLAKDRPRILGIVAEHYREHSAR